MAINEQLDTLYKLKKELEKSNNSPLINTINQVIKKVYLNQYTATFVGHFSAGKSTLINLLLEQDILPSSPIPTTSNTAIVSVAKEDEIIANLTQQQYIKLKSYNDVKQMNRQNVDVESIEINFPSNKFNLGLHFKIHPVLTLTLQHISRAQSNLCIPVTYCFTQWTIIMSNRR